MKIYYQDEYGEELHIAYNKNAVPRIGETVIIAEEEYRVREVIWQGDGDDVTVEITQNLLKQSKKDNTDVAAISEMKAAIASINNRHDKQEKKQRLLSEQVVSIRKHINTNIRQERKDNDTR